MAKKIRAIDGIEIKGSENTGGGIPEPTTAGNFLRTNLGTWVEGVLKSDYDANVNTVNTTGNIIDFDKDYIHNSLLIPTTGGYLTVGSGTKINGKTVTAYLTGGSSFKFSPPSGSSAVVFGVYDPNTTNIIYVTYHEVGSMYVVNITNGYTTVNVDVAPPVLISATVNEGQPDRVIAKFSEVVVGSSQLGYTVSGLGITSITGWGSDTLTIIVNTNFSVGDSRSLSYNSAIGDTKDTASTPNVLATFSNFLITNNIFGGFNITTIPWYGYWNAVNVDKNINNVVTRWNDLSGNNNHLTPANSPLYLSSGINGKPAINFSGSSYFTIEAFTQSASQTLLLDNITTFAVFQFNDTIPNGTYGQILLLGSASFTTPGSNWLQLLNPASMSTTLRVNYPSTAQDQDFTVASLLDRHSIITRQSVANNTGVTLDQGAEVIKSGNSPIFLRNMQVGYFSDGVATNAGGKFKLAAFGIAPRLTNGQLSDLKAWINLNYVI